MVSEDFVDEPETPAKTWKPKTVLVGFDDLDDPTEVVEAGIELAAAEGAEVTFLQVVPPTDWRVRELGPAAMASPQRLAVDAGDHELNEAAARAKARGVTSHRLLVSGGAAEQIVEVATEIGADLIVVGSHRRSALSDLLLGNVSMRVIKHAKQPVLLIHTEESEHSR
jgi:nucleotide-binding universal stress UspA family protein